MLSRLKSVFLKIAKSIIPLMWLLVVLMIVYFYSISQNHREEIAENTSQRAVYDAKEEKFLVLNKYNPSLPKIENKTSNDQKVTNDVDASSMNSKVKNLPKISFLVVNLGLSESATKMSVSLPAEVAIGISTYSANIPYWENEFANDNHEIYAELPLEPEDYKTEDRGFLSILSYNTNKQNQDNFLAITKKFVRIVGLYTFGSEVFSSSDKAKAFYTIVKEKGLRIAYGSQNIGADVAKLFKTVGISHIASPVVIDGEVTEDYINNQLRILEDRATSSGKAYAILRPYPISIRLVNNWIDKNQKEGKLNIVKLSDLMDGK